MERGFVKDLNFREITREGQANNLFVNLTRIDGITADIKLFSNNFNNISVLPAKIESGDIYKTELDASGEYVIILDINGVADGYVPYSNRTRLREIRVEQIGESTVETIRTFTQAEENQIVAASNGTIGIGQVVDREMILTVYEANVVDRFKVKDQYGFNRNVEGDLVRPDIITKANLRNMSVDREDTITDSISVDNESGDINATNNVGYISAPIATNYSEIDNGLSMFRYKQSRLVLGYEETSLSKPAVVDGYINITNRENVDVTDLENNPPGLYINPPTGGSPIKAFSDTSNPWEKVEDWNIGDRLITTAQKITVQRLVLDNPKIQPTTFESRPKVESNNLLGNNKYKVKVEIDGVPYFLFALEE
jgi:hypothetical protein